MEANLMVDRYDDSQEPSRHAESDPRVVQVALPGWLTDQHERPAGRSTNLRLTRTVSPGRSVPVRDYPAFSDVGGSSKYALPQDGRYSRAGLPASQCLRRQ